MEKQLNFGLDQRDIAPREEDLRDVQARHTDPGITLRYLERDSLARHNERDTQARHGDRDVTEQYVDRDTATPGDQRDVTADTAAPARETTGDRDDLDHTLPIDPADAVEPSTTPRDDLLDLSADHDDTTVNRGDAQGQDDPATENHEPPVTDGPADQKDDDKDAAAPTGDGDRSGELPSGKGAVIARMRTYARECAAQGHPVTGADLDRQFGTRDYGRKVLRQLAAESAHPA